MKSLDEMGDYVSQEFLFRRKKVVTVKDGKKLIKDKVYFWVCVMIEANLIGEYHIS
jgi:transcriptional antiterminator NusG